MTRNPGMKVKNMNTITCLTIGSGITKLSIIIDSHTITTETMMTHKNVLINQSFIVNKNDDDCLIEVLRFVLLAFKLS